MSPPPAASLSRNSWEFAEFSLSTSMPNLENRPSFSAATSWRGRPKRVRSLILVGARCWLSPGAANIPKEVIILGASEEDVRRISADRRRRVVDRLRSFASLRMTYPSCFALELWATPLETQARIAKESDRWKKFIEFLQRKGEAIKGRLR